MISLLSKYLSVILIKHFAALTCLVMVMGSLIEFLDDKDGILNDTQGNVSEILKYMVFISPDVFSRLAPLIAVVAASTTMIGLVRYRELVAVISAGVSQWRLMAALFPAALLIACFQFLMDNSVLSRSVHELRDLGVGKYSEIRRGRSTEIWLQEGNDILAVRQIGSDLHEVGKIDIFKMDEKGRFTGHISGAEGRLDDGKFVLQNVVQTKVGEQTPIRTSTFTYELSIDPAILLALFLDPKQMSWFDLDRILQHPNTGNRPYFVYRLRYYKKLTAPIATLAIIMLIVPLVQRFNKISNNFSLLFLGLSIGFVFIMLDAIVVSFGEIGLLPPLVASGAMTLILIAVVGTAIFHQELIKETPVSADESTTT